MMASFLPVIVSKKQTSKEKYVFYCNASQIPINPEKTRKNTKMTSSDVPSVGSQAGWPTIFLISDLEV